MWPEKLGKKSRGFLGVGKNLTWRIITGLVSSWPTAHRTPWAFVHILTFHLILHTCWMLRNWSGVGGGGDDNIPCTCTHVGCYATGQGWVGGVFLLSVQHGGEYISTVFGYI